MQDRFKFRAVYYNDVEKKYFIFEPDLISADGTARAYAYGESGADEYYDTVTLNQCTGLKDKNGKLIYEGDIINVKIDGLNISYIPKVVVWDRKEWQLKQYNKNFKQNCSACEVKRKQKCQYCSQYFSATGHTNFKEFYNNEVIGNIYQDKELLNEV